MTKYKGDVSFFHVTKEKRESRKGHDVPVPSLCWRVSSLIFMDTLFVWESDILLELWHY